MPDENHGPGNQDDQWCTGCDDCPSWGDCYPSRWPGGIPPPREEPDRKKQLGSYNNGQLHVTSTDEE